jgi:hypothetical protein
LNELKAFELMEHFLLLHLLNATYKEMEEKVDVDENVSLVSLFHISKGMGGGININDFFFK